ncbi:hypothetical protein HanRHA438_Chr05g0224961 [Helianthus annuus]|nr:hypothetical protein HanRHA438_Chr05g0224961 [Helianthus annuus]
MMITNLENHVNILILFTCFKSFTKIVLDFFNSKTMHQDEYSDILTCFGDNVYKGYGEGNQLYS